LFVHWVHWLLPLQSAGVSQQPGMRGWGNGQPSVGVQVSSVQVSLSSQSGGGPGRQMPDWHDSLPLQRSLSLQLVPLIGSFLHLFAVQVSVVHGFPSLHSAGTVHGFSTHVPVGGLHTLPAGQTTSVPCWQPFGPHVSVPLQRLLSLGHETC
jgi:hypothetical protein